MAEYNKESNTFTMSVREITDFVFRDGDVASDGYSVPEEKMLAGAKFHRTLEARMEKKGWMAEYRTHVEYTFPDGITVLISGIADLVKFNANVIEVGEIKTVSGDVDLLDWDSIPKYTAQTTFYAYMLLLENHRIHSTISIIYHNLELNSTNTIKKQLEYEQAQQFFCSTMLELHKWLRLWLDHVNKRNQSIKELAFPYGDYRKGQRQLCACVYRAVRDGGKLFVEAPTGTGKTISALFPAIKAMGEDCGGKIFYLTAKVITRNVAKDAVKDMTEHGLYSRSIVLTAKTKSCLGDGKCLPQLCKYSKGHGERVNEALYALVCENLTITPELVAEYAEKYVVCPHELALDATYFCDIVIGDYNHAYDPNAMLQRYFAVGGDYVLLVDEAHNLPDRAREMYSAVLDASRFKEASGLLKGVKSGVKGKLSRLATEIVNIGVESEKKLREEQGMFNVSEKRCVGSIEKFKGLLSAFCEAYRKFLSKSDFDHEKEQTIDLYFDCKFFLKLTELADIYSGAFSVYFDETSKDKKLNIVCTDPSGILADSALLSRCTVFFSATLRPFDYYFDILGGNKERDRHTVIESPFSQENLLCATISGISTRYKDRENSYGDVAEVIYEMISHRIGNYMVFFPSFRYLDCVHELFCDMCDDSVDIIAQTPDMTDEERADFLSHFDSYGKRTLVGFTVCGGVFSEGIDLKGEKLSGAIIVGTGMPAVCFERDLLKKAYSKSGKSGFDYAYTYPGLNRVFQAGGRVIRSESDKGFVLLIDDRFAKSSYSRHFPNAWKPVLYMRSIEGLTVVADKLKKMYEDDK